MVRRRPQPEATQHIVLDCQQVECHECGQLMHNKYDNHRRVRTLSAVVHLQLKVRRCVNPECRCYRHVYRPERESQWALPQQEFGLDVMAYAGGLRYREHRSVTEIHQCLEKRGVSISERSVSNQLASYEELVALRGNDLARVQGYCQAVRTAITDDGLPPLNPAGLRLHQRLSAIEQSLTRLEQSSPCPHR